MAECDRHLRGLFVLRQPGIRRLHFLVLLALALRAAIPIGFMPAGDGTLSLMICPGGFPLALLPQQKMMRDGMTMPVPRPHQHRGQGAADDAYCIFTTGFGAAPPLLLLVAFGLLVAALALVLARVPVPTGIRFVYVPQARAPPSGG